MLFDFNRLEDLALQGWFGGQLDSTTTVSGRFGAKYFFSDGLALRAGVGFFTTSSTGTINISEPAFTADLSSTTVVIAPSLSYNIASSNTVVRYVGGGLQYIAAINSSEINDTAATINLETSSTLSGFGGGALFSIEWFPWENVSLSAEYALGFTMSSTSSESTSGETTITIESPSTTGIGISSRGRLTAGFYLIIEREATYIAVVHVVIF